MAIMPNVVGLGLSAAEGALKAAGVLVPLSLGYFGGGTLRTQQGTVAGAAAIWPITVIWVNKKTASGNLDGNANPAVPGLVLTQSPAPGATIAVNATVTLSAVQPAMSISYPGTNLTNGFL